MSLHKQWPSAKNVQEKNHRRTVWNKINTSCATATMNKTATANFKPIRHQRRTTARRPDFPPSSGAPGALVKFPFLGGRGGGESVAVFMRQRYAFNALKSNRFAAGVISDTRRA